jgi:hypothetical protein
MIPLSLDQAQSLVDGADRGCRALTYLSAALEAWGSGPGAVGPIPLSESQAVDILGCFEWGSPPACRYLEDALEAHGWHWDTAGHGWVGAEATPV